MKWASEKKTPSKTESKKWQLDTIAKSGRSYDVGASQKRQKEKQLGDAELSPVEQSSPEVGGRVPTKRRRLTSLAAELGSSSNDDCDRRGEVRHWNHRRICNSDREDFWA